MRRFLIVLSLALPCSPAAMGCPPVDGGGSFGSAYGADACAAPMVAGNFGMGGYGGGAMFAAPSYSASFAAPAYSAPVIQRQVFAAPAYGYSAAFSTPVRVRSFAAPAYGYGSFGVSRRFGYGSAVVAAPVVHTRAFAAPVYGSAVVAAPVVAVPVRAVGPIRGAIQGFRGGLRNRLNGF
jgi:hypothetical protein